jgi:hypothetical protein
LPAGAEPGAQKIEVFPNPTRGHLTLQVQLTYPMSVKIRVFSTDGRLLSEPVREYRDIGLNELNLDLESLASFGSTLILQVEIGDEVFRQKVMLY